MNVLCAVLSIFVPGLGQLVRGRVVSGLGFFIACGVAFVFAGLTMGLGLIVAVPLWAWCIANAAKE